MTLPLAPVVLIGVLLGLGGCAYDQYSSNQLCARTAGCVSGFPATGEGPIQAQAVAPVSAGALLPQD